jgi:hypothetical protein
MMPLDSFFRYPNKRRIFNLEVEDDEHSPLEVEDDDERHEYNDFTTELQADDNE